MAKYYQKKRRSKKERIGFYTSLSICIIAVGMAAYSTYTNFADYIKDDTDTVAVNNVATGVTEQTEEVTEVPTTVETEPATEVTESTADQTTESLSALQTMLSVESSLGYPVDSHQVQKEYSEETVYNKTLNQWNAHTGVDFSCDVGDNIYAMSNGQVDKIYKDDLLGNVIAIKFDNYTIYYCGMSDNTNVNAGDTVNKGDVIALASVVPSEAMDDSHIHIEVKVGDSYTDPLTLINNDE